MKKFLIIGSCGFIGNHISEYFKNLGHDVYTADILIKKEQNYFILNSESSNFSDLFNLIKFDVCINASGAANVNLSFDYPELDFNLNTSNVYKLLTAIKTYNPNCKFINFSSAAVYGDPKILPIKESFAPSPISPYGFHKYYSEIICEEFFNIYNIQTISLRVFSVYGEGLKKQLFWDLHKKIENSKNQQISILGSGKESRDFIYIHDLLQVLNLIITNLNFLGQRVNVANGEEIFINDAVELFIKIFNKPIQVNYDNHGLVGNPKNWIADISLLKQLGYIKRSNLSDGLTNYINWLNENN